MDRIGRLTERVVLRFSHFTERIDGKSQAIASVIVEQLTIAILVGTARAATSLVIGVDDRISSPDRINLRRGRIRQRIERSTALAA